MTDHEKLVMRNIIYAVETGGQVYGQKDYADFTEAYTNSSAEHAITIGAGQWYGNEARTLLLKIKTTDAATFSKYDTAGVAADLNKTDWSNYQLSKTSAKAKAIVHIINSTVGHRCQDQLMDGQMEKVYDISSKDLRGDFKTFGDGRDTKEELADSESAVKLHERLKELYGLC